MDKPQEARKIPVLIRDEDWDDVMGQYLKRGLGQTEDDAEGQVYILKRTEPGEQLDDTEGQGARGNWIRLEGDDTEGQGIRGGYLVPATDEDVQGQGYRGSWLRPVEDEDDTEGHRGQYFLEPEDTEGQLMKRGLGETEEDAEGQGSRFSG